MTVHRALRPAFVRLFLPALLVAASLTLATPARAEHSDGTYAGKTADGGDVVLGVGGNTVVFFDVTNLPCDEGGTGSAGADNVPIDTSGPVHAFSMTDPAFFGGGHFGPPNFVSGTITLDTPTCHDNTPWSALKEQPKPCKCKDVDVKVRPRKPGFLKVLDQVNKVKVYTFVVEKTIECEGDTGGCKVKAKVQLDGPHGTISKGKKADCSSDECPPLYKKKFEFDLKFQGNDYDWLFAKENRKLTGRVVVDCDTLTITAPFTFAFEEGKFDKKKSKLP